MDKNKNRTDLLAAGRKKLQQFRQKKDNKGSSSQGKSSKKPSKSEQHESYNDAVSNTANSTALPQVLEGELVTHIDVNLGPVDSSISQSIENSMPPDIDAAAVDSLSIPVTTEISSADNADINNHAVEVHENDIDSSNTNNEESVYVSAPAAIVETLGAVEMEGRNREKEESLPSQEDTPAMSLICARSDQEADGLGLKQFSGSRVIELEGDGKLALSEHGGNAETVEREAPEQTGMVDMASELKQNDRVCDESASASAADMSDGNLVCTLSLSEGDRTLGAVHEVANQTREVFNVGPSNVQDSEMLSGGVYHGKNEEGSQGDRIMEAYNQQYMPEESFVFVGKSHEEPLLIKLTNSDDGFATSPSGDVCPISFSQLIDVIKGLSEDDYKLLIMSRESSDSLISLPHGLPVLMERLREELFLTSCTKDILHLQLIEQSDMQTEYDDRFCQLNDEINALRASLSEARERCDFLSEELVECRSELSATVSQREELELQFHVAKAEVEEVSARINELQISLERSELDSLSMSKELSDLKYLDGALHAENENLNQNVALLTEERKKLAEDKNVCLYENEKLLEELADCKNLVAALQLESSNLSRTLASVTQKSKKLEEEKEYLANGNEKLSMDLSNSMGLMEALQVENANLRGDLTVITEDRKKLEEEKEYSVCEMERLSSELVVLHERLTKDYGERELLGIELKEVTMHLEQLTEENIFLQSSLEQHRAKMQEIDQRQAQRLSSVGEAPNQVGTLEVQSRGCENADVDEQSHQIPEKQDGEVTFSILGNSKSDGISGGSPDPFELEVFDDSLGFVVLKEHLKEAEKMLQKLEKAIEGMHSHMGSLSRTGGKVAAPAISKLIQAFESKVQHDEYEAEERAMTEDQPIAADPFPLTKEYVGDLRAMLKQLALDSVNASLLFKAERDGKRAANLTIKELKFQFESMKEHTDNLEATNIELGVLYEAVKQHFSDVKEKNQELESLYEILKQQESSLKAENGELGEKLSECESKINELQSQLHDLQQSLDELSSVLRGQLENFQKEACDRALAVEQEWNYTVAQIIAAVEKLDDSTGLPITSTIITDGHGSIDIRSHATASVDAAIKTIEDLKEKFEEACSEREATFNLFKEVNEKYNELLGKNALTNDLLQRLYCELRKLVIDSCGSLGEIEIDIQDEELPDPVDYSGYKTLMMHLEKFLAERLQLQSVNNNLNLELMNGTKDAEELKRKCVDLSSIEKLIEHVEGGVKLEDSKMDLDVMPISRLESLVSFLVRKCKEADEQVSSSREEFGSKVEELTELQEKMHQLTALKLQHETEILLLKERLSHVEEALLNMQSELQEKLSELEQSEQKVSSIREKLSIAVAKGKGLVVQRDSLKLSLSETSSELERCSQELQLKDARLHELETKLKTYSEAGERVEALESELSYIRNSATALRESFLLKDSVLQRIEEILEDLDLPENFHSRDIIEKVDWLARSATGNTLPPTDWDQKSSVGGSYSDAGFVVMDAWKEDVQPSSNSGDDLRRKYEELQGKFYGLAEQNEMLEQSLMERNQLVQRWEELLDRINMPAHLRSVEPENRIEWLGNALSEANHDRNSLLQNIDKLENYCGLLTADLEQSQKRISCLNAELEESQKKISVLEMDVQAVIHERVNLSEKLETLSCDHEKLSAKAAQLGLDNEKLQNEVGDLQEKLVQKLGNEVQRINDEICRLQDLVCDALKDPGAKDLISGGGGIECLEGLLKKLIENYTTLSLMKPVLGDADEEYHAKEADKNLEEGRTRDILDNMESEEALLKRYDVDTNEPNVDVLKKELEEALSELAYVKEERDRYMEKQQSLVCEVEALERKRVELQELLKQEEQKSTSVREKLNVAVRKGKSLVQQRDSLKQTTEEMSTELEHLKSEIKHRENALTDYELKMRDLSTYSGRVEALEAESLVMRNRFAENDRILQEKEHALTIILRTLGDIDVGGEIYNSNPIKKLEHVGKLCHDLQATVASSEEESRKSRRAAELLLAELNEVQDRNDGLQEELTKVTVELAQLSKDRDVAEAAKYEAHSRFEQLSLVCNEEKRKQFSELVLLKSAANQLRKTFSDISNFLAGFFSDDLEFLQNLESGMKSCLDRAEADIVVHVPLFSESVGMTSSNSGKKRNFMAVDFSTKTNMPDHLDDDFITEVCSSLQEISKEIDAVKIILHEHSATFHEQASNLSTLMGTIHRDMTSQRESFEAIKQDIKLIESVEKEKEMEIIALRRNIALLYEACTSSVMEIENTKAEVFANNLAVGDLGMNLKPVKFGDGLPFGGESNFSSEEHAKTMAEKLLSAVKNFASLKGEIIEGNKNEMKITISNLQKELQEKDIQRERIYKDLVGQIRQAEATAARYSLDLQSSKTRVHDLEKRVETIEDERNLLEQRVKELQNQQTISTELQEEVRSLTDGISAKDQEILALMQALDEEEVQMEDLTKKVEDLEKVVQQKNLDIENLEASRGKVAKKLSITVSKFDELHHFSESLLTEVEKLQSQLHDCDSEISFLRQEVTRCTNEALVVSQTSHKRNSDELNDLLTWLATLVSLDVNLDDSSQFNDYKEIFQKRITSILSELEDLRIAAQSRDALLQIERSKIEDLTRREEILEKSLREKESQLNMLTVSGDLVQPTSERSEILEVEPVINKWTVPGPSASQVRSLRKANNDQVAIAIDMDPSGSSRLEDEDDEKVHGFRSLTSSRIVPKFTRPVTDMIDGLWVSCDRALMRQPGLRLGIMVYWAVLHALLAAFVV